MKIKLSIEQINSKRDIYGNTYYIVHIYNNETGECFSYQDSTDNISIFCHTAGYKYGGEFIIYYSVLPIREFNRQAKNVPYMSNEEIISRLKAWL